MSRKWAYAEHGGKFWVRDQHYKMYDSGRFVVVSEEEPGVETVLKGPLNNEATAAQRLLEQAVEHLTN